MAETEKTNENLPLDDPKRTGFLSKVVRTGEELVGDVGDWKTDGTGFLGTPVPKTLNPLNPFHVVPTPADQSLGDKSIVDESESKPDIIPPALPENYITQEGASGTEKIKKWFSKDEELVKIRRSKSSRCI